MTDEDYTALPVNKIKSAIENGTGSKKWDWTTMDTIARRYGRDALCYNCSNDGAALIQFLYERIIDHERRTK
jgi:hypothetical protein